MARIFDADSGTLRATLAGHEEAVRAAAFGADPRTVATASTDGTIRLWDARPFPVLRRVDKLASSAEAVAFEPGGSRIVSAGRADLRNRLFALSDDPRLAFPAQGFEGVARSQPVALGTSENGRVLVSSHRDGTIREWRSDDEQNGFEVRHTIEPDTGFSGSLHRDRRQPGRIAIRRGLEKRRGRPLAHEREARGSSPGSGAHVGHLQP